MCICHQLTVGLVFTPFKCPSYRFTTMYFQRKKLFGAANWTGVTLHLGHTLMCNKWTSTAEEVELCDTVLKGEK